MPRDYFSLGKDGIDLPNNFPVRGRNAADTADVALIRLNTSNIAEIGPNTFALGGAAGPIFTTFAGTPESNVTAPLGSYCCDTTNGEGYIKKTGAGNTGWKLVTHA